MKNLIEHLLEKNFFNLNIVELSLIPEFFLGFSIIVSLCVSLIAYNKKYWFSLTEKIMERLAPLFLFLTLILLLNDCLFFKSKQMDLTCILFCYSISALSKVMLLLVYCVCFEIIWQYNIVQSCKLITKPISLGVRLFIYLIAVYYLLQVIVVFYCLMVNLRVLFFLV